MEKKPLRFTGKKKGIEPPDLINPPMSPFPTDLGDLWFTGKKLQQSVLGYLGSTPKSGELGGSEPKAAASSEICLCYCAFGQSYSLEDEGAARTGEQKKTKAYTIRWL